MEPGDTRDRSPRWTVSVIVPAYNAAWCVGDALESLVLQTLEDFEVVVVDDGSTDETAAVVQEWIDRGRLRGLRLVRQENKRLGGARNAGIRLSSAPLVAFLDADDRWFPERLERVVETFSSLPGEVGLVCHDELATRDGRALGTIQYGPWKERMYEHLLWHGSCLSPSAVTVRRELVEASGGFSEDPAFHSIEDYDLWLRLSRQTTFYFLHETLGEYRLHGESLSARIDYNVSNELSVLDAHLASHFAGRSPSPRDHLRMRRRRHTVHRQGARKLLASGDRAGARRHLLTALRLYPFDPKAVALASLFAAGALRRARGTP